MKLKDDGQFVIDVKGTGGDIIAMIRHAALECPRTRAALLFGVMTTINDTEVQAYLLKEALSALDDSPEFMEHYKASQN